MNFSGNRDAFDKVSGNIETCLKQAVFLARTILIAYFDFLKIIFIFDRKRKIQNYE